MLAVEFNVPFLMQLLLNDDKIQCLIVFFGAKTQQATGYVHHGAFEQ